MKNNDSPYIYEKPLRPRKSKRALAMAAASIAGIGSVIGGTAFASAIVGSVTGDKELTPVSSATGLVSENTNKQPIDSSVFSGQTSPEVSAISIPITSAQPTKGSAQIQLPAVSSTDWGNLSSATPSAGSGYGGNGETRDDDDDDYEDRDHEDDDDHEEEDDHEDDNDEDSDDD